MFIGPRLVASASTPHESHAPARRPSSPPAAASSVVRPPALRNVRRLIAPRFTASAEASFDLGTVTGDMLLADLHRYPFEPFAPRHHASTRDLELVDVIERVNPAHADASARHQSDLFPMGHARRVGVADLAHRGARAPRQGRE